MLHANPSLGPIYQCHGSCRLLIHHSSSPPYEDVLMVFPSGSLGVWVYEPKSFGPSTGHMPRHRSTFERVMWSTTCPPPQTNAAYRLTEVAKRQSEVVHLRRCMSNSLVAFSKKDPIGSQGYGRRIPKVRPPLAIGGEGSRRPRARED